MNIRNYQPADYQAVKKILEQEKMFDETWEAEENLAGLVSKDPEAIAVAIEDNAVIGVIMMMQHTPLVVFLFRLVVAKEYRHKGIGTALIKHAESRAKTRGVKEVAFLVDSHKASLLEYYKQLGFKKSDSEFFFHWKEIE